MEVEACVFCNNPLADVKAKRTQTSRLVFHSVECPKCGATGPRALTPKTAVSLWNKGSKKEDGDC